MTPKFRPQIPVFALMKIKVGALSPRVGWDFKVPASNQNFIMRPNGGVTQVNSGVFLMNLTRLREERLVTSGLR